MAENDVRGLPEVSGLWPADAAEIAALSSKPAYDTFLAAARALDKSAIQECRANLALAYHNVKRGVENVLGDEAALARLPQVKLEDLQTLPQLAQGLAFAALQVHRNLEAASFGPLFERAQQLRRKLYKAADALAEANLLLEADAEEVRHQGQHDLIEDCVALAALFRRNEATIAGRSPVATADIEEAEQVAEKLRAALAPGGGAPTHVPPPVIEAAEMRDRFWTLLSQRHELLWRCGAWLQGQAVEERVPPLQAREPVVRKPKEAATALVVAPSSSAPQPSVSRPLETRSRPPINPTSELARKTRFLIRFGVIPPSR